MINAILREALNEYITTRLSIEDRRALLDSILRDVELYRQNNSFEIDENDDLTEDELKSKFLKDLKEDWKIEN